MEARPQQAQGQVELGGEQQDEERLLEGQAPVKQAQADLDGDDGGAERGDHLQRQGGEEGDAQHTHGRQAEALGGVADDLDLRPAAGEHLERCQPLEHVEGVGVEAGEGGPLAAGGGLRLVADEHHENGDERGGEEQDQGGEGVDGEDEEQEDQRRKGSQGELGQVLGVIGVQGFDTLGGGSHELAAALSAGIGGTQVEEAAEQARAQVELEAAGEGGGGKRSPPQTEQSTREDKDEEERQGRQHLIEGGAAQEDAADYCAGLRCLEDGEHAGSHAEQDGARQEQEGAAGQKQGGRGGGRC